MAAELAEVGRTANQEPSQSVPRMRNREKREKPCTVWREEGEQGKPHSQQRWELKGPELYRNSTVRLKSIPSPGCSQHFPLSEMSVPPTCQSQLPLFAGSCRQLSGLPDHQKGALVFEPPLYMPQGLWALSGNITPHSFLPPPPLASVSKFLLLSMCGTPCRGI